MKKKRTKSKRVVSSYKKKRTQTKKKRVKTRTKKRKTSKKKKSGGDFLQVAKQIPLQTLRIGEEGLKVGVETAKLGQEGIKVGQEGLKVGQETAKVGQEGLKMTGKITEQVGDATANTIKVFGKIGERVAANQERKIEKNKMRNEEGLDSDKEMARLIANEEKKKLERKIRRRDEKYENKERKRTEKRNKQEFKRKHKEFKRKQKEMYAHGYPMYPYMDQQPQLGGGKKKKKRTKKKKGGAISGVPQAPEGTGAFGQSQVIQPAPQGGVVVPPAPIPEGALGIANPEDAPPQPLVNFGGPQQDDPPQNPLGFGGPAPQDDDDAGELGALFDDDDEEYELGPGPAWQQVQQQYNPGALSNVPVIGFGGPQEEEDDENPTFVKEWVNLNPQELEQAEELGFVEESWPNQPPNWKEWGELGNDERLAAEGLDFTEDVWKGLQFEVGEIVERKNEGSPWNDGMVTSNIPLLVTISSIGDGEGVEWYDVRKKEPVYIRSWEDLTQQQKLGVQILEWGQDSWDQGYAPPNYVEWDQLSEDKKLAVNDLEFTEDIWNNLEVKEEEEGEEVEVQQGQQGQQDQPSNPKWTSLITVKRKEPEVQEETSKASKWEKFKGLFKGTDYEQFINQSGLELKNLYISYLNEYFQDLKDGEDLDILKAKYMSFVDKYYQEAVKNDQFLIKKLKEV